MSNILPGKASARSWSVLRAPGSSAPSPASCPNQWGKKPRAGRNLGMGPGQTNPDKARRLGRRCPRCQGKGREDAAWQGRRQPGGTGWGRQPRAPSGAGLEARARLSAARSSLFWKGGVLAERLVSGAADAGEQDGSQRAGPSHALRANAAWLQPVAESAPAQPGLDP